MYVKMLPTIQKPGLQPALNAPFAKLCPLPHRADARLFAYANRRPSTLQSLLLGLFKGKCCIYKAHLSKALYNASAFISVTLIHTLKHTWQQATKPSVGATIGSNLGFSVFPKDISKGRQEESGIKPLTFSLVDKPLYLLSHGIRDC